MRVEVFGKQMTFSHDAFIEQVTANIKDCENSDLETTAVPIHVIVDNDHPIVNCTLATQGLRGNGGGAFADLKLNYTAVDGGNQCTAIDDLEVVLEVLSNEVAVGGEEVRCNVEHHSSHSKFLY